MTKNDLKMESLGIVLMDKRERTLILYMPILHVIRATLDWDLLAMGSIHFKQ